MTKKRTKKPKPEDITADAPTYTDDDDAVDDSAYRESLRNASPLFRRPKSDPRDDELWQSIGICDWRRFVDRTAGPEHAPYVSGARFRVVFPTADGGVRVETGTLRGTRHPSAAPELNHFVLELDPIGACRFHRVSRIVADASLELISPPIEPHPTHPNDTREHEPPF